MTEKKGKLRWKRNPAPTGLMRVGYGPRGYTLHDGVTEFAHVSYSKYNQYWYWTCPDNEAEGILYFNSVSQKLTYSDEDTAKIAARKYIDSQRKSK